MKTNSTLIRKSLLRKSSLIIFLFTLGLLSNTTLRAQITIIGMTNSGGAKDSGLLFKCTPGGVLTPLVSNLDMTNGATPFQCGVMLANDGKFYGMTEEGGAHNDGVIFRCDTIGTITVLYSFDNAVNGRTPRGNLIQANDGNLYGVTYGGGANADGTVFKCTLAGVVTTIASFTAATTGQFPRGTLLQANDGNLYGMTQGGGANGDGVLLNAH